MVGVAVKVTLVPAQIVCAPAVIAMLTLGVTFELTVIAMLLLVAVAVVWQVLFAVITQLIASLFAKPASV